MASRTDLILDWVKYLPYPYIDELKSLVEVGYTNSEALVAATRTGAEILHMGDRLGTLEAGKLADIIVIDGTPDENLDDLARVDRAFANGRITVAAGRIQSEPHRPLAAPQRKSGVARRP